VHQNYIRADAAYFDNLIVDTITGEYFALADHALTVEEGRLWIRAWSNRDQLLVYSVVDRSRDHVSGLFLGEPNGAFQRLPIDVPEGPIGAASFSPDGELLAVEHLTATPAVLIVATDTLDVIQRYEGVHLPATPWSFDGRYLALQHRTNYQPTRLDIARVADRHVTELGTGFAPAWSRVDSWLAYVKEYPLDERPKPVKVMNLDTGQEFAAGSGSAPLQWSPDNHYLAVTQAEGQLSRVRILDMTGVKRPVDIRGAGLKRWLDEDTLAIVANVCGSGDLAIVGADGSAFVKLTMTLYAGYRAAFTADGRRFALGATVFHLDGTSTAFDTKPYGFNRDGPNWSANGRFLILSVPPPGEGPCYPVPTPQATTIEFP
jgi:hypothetical protein